MIEMRMVDRRLSYWVIVEQIQTEVRRRCRLNGSFAEDSQHKGRKEEAHSSVNTSWPLSSHPVTDNGMILDANGLAL